MAKFADLSREEKIAILQQAEAAAPLPFAQRPRAEKIRLLQQAQAAEAEAQAAEPSALSELPEQAQAFVESIGSGGSSYLLPRAQAKLGEYMPDPSAEINEQLKAQGFTIQEPENTYESRLAANIARQQAQAEKFPITTTVGNVVGALGTGMGVGRGLGWAAGKVAPKAVAAYEALQSGTKAQSAAKAAAEAAMKSAATPQAGQAARAAFKEASKGLLGKKALALGAQSAAFAAEGSVLDLLSGEAPGTGALTGAAIPGATVLAKTIPSIAKGTLKVVSGVSDDAIRKALADPELLKTTRTPKELSVLANEAARVIQQKSIQTGAQLTDEINMAFNRMSKKASELSSEGFEILEKADLKIPKNEIAKIVQKEKNKLMVGGKPPISGPYQDAVARADRLINDLEFYPDTLSGPQVKQVLSQLREEVSYNKNINKGFLSQPDRMMQQITHNIDHQLLKANAPEYVTKMTEASNIAGLLDEIQPLVADPKKTLNTLSRTGDVNLKNLPEHDILNRFLKAGGISAEEFRRAQEAADIVGAWDEMATASKIESLGGAKNHKLREIFKLLSDQSPEDIVRLAESMNARTQFQKEFMRGSRNILLWGAVGAAAGLGLGGTGLSTVVGMMGGGMLDRFGPQVALEMLRFVGTVKGIPTISKIMNAKLSPKAKQGLIDSLMALQTRKGHGEEDPGVVVDPIDRVETIKDIQTAKNVSPLEKANMLKSLADGEPIKGFDKVVFGNQKPKEVVSPKKAIKPAVTITDIARKKKAETFDASPGAFIEQKKEEDI